MNSWAILLILRPKLPKSTVTLQVDAGESSGKEVRGSKTGNFSMSRLVLQAPQYAIICHYPECGNILELAGCLSPSPGEGSVYTFIQSANKCLWTHAIWSTHKLTYQSIIGYECWSWTREVGPAWSLHSRGKREPINQTNETCWLVGTRRQWCRVL